ncbi:MAG: hypothetical protein AAF555_03470 [Verrucomicrobiota bacterium]
MGAFFPGEQAELESRLQDHFTRVRESLPSELFPLVEALVLGGGYGRGEGGVLESATGPKLYNDLDYFLFTSEPENEALLEWVRAMEREETAALEIDVEVKCLPKSDVAEASSSMMFFDLVSGHHVVFGPEDYLAEAKSELRPGCIQLAEATRLLWNRGSGLYFSRCRVGQREEPDFVLRNHAKAKLAFGDAWLVLQSSYVASCQERGRRMAQVVLPEGLESLRELHRQGVAFKISPQALGELDGWGRLEAENRALRALWQKVFLRVERERLGLELRDFRSYARAQHRLGHGAPLWKNPLLALRDRQKRGGHLRPVWDYPRGALYRALVLLNAEESGEGVERFLPPEERDGQGFQGWERSFEKWWHFYS